MSDCPVLSSKDRELMNRFSQEIAYFRANEPPKEVLFSCPTGGRPQYGGSNEYLVNAIAFAVTAISAGASAYFILAALPVSVQMYLVSLVNFTPSLPVCKTNLSYALGTAASAIGFEQATCEYRAKMLSQGILKLGSLVGGLTGIALKNKIRELLDGQKAGKRSKKSRRTRARKSRRPRKSRRNRKSRKY